MDFAEPSNGLLSRIRKVDPENSSKILGYLLINQDNDELAGLASSPEHHFQQVVLRVQAELLRLQQFSALNRRSQFWDQHKLSNASSDVFGPFSEPAELQSLPQLFLGAEDPVEGFYPGARANRRLFNSSVGTEFPVKTCHYFNKGFCKHGSSCRYAHGQVVPENFVHLYGNDPFPGDEQVLSPVSLEKLELEIVELLKLRRGNPVSIASLPAMYYEKYGKYLQAEGYLTESQRHGKAGYSLTKLLARLKNSIRLIDRPHGQHAVILVEDAMKYGDNRNEKSDPGPIVSGSRQIYLTFPAESTFTEEDVSSYFATFGPVEDVRIPCQQKRMFGFVTFVSADTVKMILSNGNPHFVCGARVLVKPYREKSKIMDRKFSDRSENVMLYQPSYSDMEADFYALRHNRLMRKQYQEQQEQERALVLEDESRRIQLAEKPVNNQSFFNYPLNELTVPEEQLNFPHSEQFSRLFDALNCGSTSAEVNYNDQDSLNLPDSPFSSSIVNGVSTVR